MKSYVKFLWPYEKKLMEGIKKRGLTITVSGLAGSGKTTGAQAIADSFGLKCYEIGGIQKALAKKRGISLEQQVKIREAKVDYAMDRKALQLAMKGGYVLVGRLTGWVAGKWADVKILYTAPLRIRARRIAKREKIPVAEALRKIRLRDSEDRKRYRKIYGIDITDRSIYDIVLDTSKLSLEESKRFAVRAIKNFLRRKKTVIAISGLPGAGSTTIAKELAKKLGLKYFSPGELFKSHASGKETEAALRVWKGVGRKKRFHLGLDSLQRKIARKGNCVICGKLSLFILRDLADWKIWLQAPLAIRARRVSKRDRLPINEARKYLKEREEIERKEWKKMYGIDYLQQKKIADLVIDTSNLTPKEVVEKISKLFSNLKYG